MEQATPPVEHAAPTRRNFLSAASAVIVGGIVALTPLAAGIAFFLNPLLRPRSNYKGSDAEGFFEVAKLSELPDDGTPLRFVLRADKLDAWNEFKDQTIGTVYLRKLQGDQVLAFSDTCPHLGCKVEYQERTQSFLCPCHASAFKLDGEPMNKIPPRPLDELKWKVDSQGQVWVKYQEFQSGIKQQEAVG